MALTAEEKKVLELEARAKLNSMKNNPDTQKYNQIIQLIVSAEPELTINEAKNKHLIQKLINSYSQISGKEKSIQETYDLITKPEHSRDIVKTLLDYNQTKGLEEGYIKDIIMSQIDNSHNIKKNNLSYGALEENELLNVAHQIEKSVINISVDRGEVNEWGQKMLSSGSGSIAKIDEEHGIAYIITNEHVIRGGNDFNNKTGKNNSVKLDFNITSSQNSEGKIRGIKGTIIGSDHEKDISVIAVNIKDLHLEALFKLTSIDFGNSDNVKPGDSIIAAGGVLGGNILRDNLGKPIKNSLKQDIFEERSSLTFGKVSAVNASVRSDNNIHENMIQSKIMTYPGHSGGPSFNAKGEFVGMNSSTSDEIHQFKNIETDTRERRNQMKQMLNYFDNPNAYSNKENLAKFSTNLKDMGELVDNFNRQDAKYKEKLETETERKKQIRKEFEVIYSKISTGKKLTDLEREALLNESEKITKKEIDIIVSVSPKDITTSSIPSNIINEYIKGVITQYETKESLQFADSKSKLQFEIPPAEKNLILGSIEDEQLKKLLIEKECFRYIDEIGEAKYLKKREAGSYLTKNNQDMGSLYIKVENGKVVITPDNNITVNINNFFKAIGDNTVLSMRSSEADSQASVEIKKEAGKTLVKLQEHQALGETTSLKLSEVRGAKIIFDNNGQLAIKCQNAAELQQIQRIYKDFVINGKSIDELAPNFQPLAPTILTPTATVIANSNAPVKTNEMPDLTNATKLFTDGLKPSTDGKFKENPKSGGISV